MRNFSLLSAIAVFLVVVTSASVLLSFVFSTSSNQNIERDFTPLIHDTFDNVTSVDLRGTLRNRKTSRDTIPQIYVPMNENRVRVLNNDDYTRHSIVAQSLTQELYGIIDFPQGATRATFQKIYDEYVESYFSLKVNPTLFLDSKITVTNVVMPSIGDHYRQRQRRNLEIIQDYGEKHEGASVIITYNQHLSYSFPISDGTLPLETLTTLPFLTESSRNEFNVRLIESEDSILKDVIGVSEIELVHQSPAAQPVDSPVQMPGDGLSPQPVNSPTDSPVQMPGDGLSPQPVNSPTQSPKQPPTPAPSKRSPPAPPPTPPKPPPTSTEPPPPPPSKPPVIPPTAKPTIIPRFTNPRENDMDSGGVSGLLIIVCLMLVLFIAFTINMKYCMGEYVD
jgi:hypothetical protein